MTGRPPLSRQLQKERLLEPSPLEMQPESGGVGSSLEGPSFLESWNPGISKAVCLWVLMGGDFLEVGLREYPDSESLAAASGAPALHELHQYELLLRNKHYRMLARPVHSLTSHRPAGQKAFEAMLFTSNVLGKLRYVHFNPKSLGPEHTLPALLAKAAKHQIDVIFLVGTATPEDRTRSGHIIGGYVRYVFPARPKGNRSYEPDAAAGMELFISKRLFHPNGVVDFVHGKGELCGRAGYVRVRRRAVAEQSFDITFMSGHASQNHFKQKTAHTGAILEPIQKMNRKTTQTYGHYFGD